MCLLIILCGVSHMRKLQEYHLSHLENTRFLHFSSYKSIYGLHVSSKGSVNPAHFRRLDCTLAVCIPVYEVIGLFTRRSDSAACEQYRRRSVCAFAQSHQRPCCSHSGKHVVFVEPRPVFGASDKARPKPVSPATET